MQQKLNERIPGGAKVIASDSGKGEIEPAFPTEKIDQKKALAKYNPEIVICSWMPFKEDWTADFRAEKSVQEYILIGETDDGCCGDKWRTWGNKRSLDEKERRLRENQLPPYKADGFERINLHTGTLQASRIDFLEGRGTTSTVSFRGKT